MARFRVIIKKKAQKDIAAHKMSGDKASIRKIQEMRINKKDRMIYKVEDDIVTVYVISAMGHYKGK